jgi:putative DNA primase/helicase
MKPTPEQIREVYAKYGICLDPDARGECRVRCPFHDDRNPSLSIKAATGLWCCHAGCGGGSVFDFVMGKENCDFNAAKAIVSPGGSLGFEVARYDYRDESGLLLYQCVRYQPKNFRVRRPDPSRSDAWLWNLGAARRVPYRLQELLSHAPNNNGANTLFVVEGEKDVESLRAIGLVATTSIGGHGQRAQWRNSIFAELFNKLHIIIIPDNDKPGTEYADTVAKALQGIATSIRVFVLPGDGVKDASDWLASGGTNEALLEMAEQTLEWRPREAARTQEPTVAESPAITVIPVPGENLTDVGNGKRLARRHGRDLRYCTATGWLVWDANRWKQESREYLEVCRRAKDTARSIFFEEAAKVEDDDKRAKILKWGFATEKGNRIKNMIEQAKSEPGIPVAEADLDSNPMLLNVLNGTLDLRTGQLKAHDRSDLITRIAHVKYEIDGTSPSRFLDFLTEVMDKDREMIEYLQRFFGYCLVGGNPERLLHIFQGAGSNGKTVLMETIRSVLGDYCCNADPSTILERRNESVRNDLARLKGVRCVTMSETQHDAKLDESLVKAVTGGDQVTARFLYREYFDFVPKFKPIMSTNHRPVVRGTDDAIWNRIRLIQFNVTIPPEKQDRKLIQKLQAEAPGILAWFVAGCVRWQREGLAPPSKVAVATANYREEMDTFSRFLGAYCKRDKNCSVLTAELHSAYESWCRESNEHPVNKRSFGVRLSAEGFVPGRTTGGDRLWRGLRILDSNERLRSSTERGAIDVALRR